MGAATCRSWFSSWPAFATRLTLNPHTQNRRVRHPESSYFLSSVPPADFFADHLLKVGSKADVHRHGNSSRKFGNSRNSATGKDCQSWTTGVGGGDSGRTPAQC